MAEGTREEGREGWREGGMDGWGASEVTLLDLDKAREGQDAEGHAFDLWLCVPATDPNCGECWRVPRAGMSNKWAAHNHIPPS